MNIILLIVVIGAVYLFLKEKGERSRLDQLLGKYNNLISREEFESNLDKNIQSKQNDIDRLTQDLLTLEENVKTHRGKLIEYEAEEYVQSFGFYKPIYNFDNSDVYKERLDNIRSKQKLMIKDKVAAVCHARWEVEGSRRKGTKMTNDFLKLVLMAFNGECDSLIPSVKYNNVDTIKNRIIKTFEKLNKLSESTHIEIANSYLNLKIDELYLFHEYQEKKQDEKEEQRRIKEQMREEDRVRKEMEKARKDAEKEEKRYQQALEKARQEVENADAGEKDILMKRVRELEELFSKAKVSHEKAISRAQMTKSGHVYIVSNVGSFGEDVYRIGMTRRLPPTGPISEWSAVVPFPFDIHATIFSENALEMESLLHQKFRDRRINKVNDRREFFRVSLEEIKQAASEIAMETGTVKQRINFTMIASAEEYRRTQAFNREMYS